MYIEVDKICIVLSHMFVDVNDLYLFDIKNKEILEHSQ